MKACVVFCTIRCTQSFQAYGDNFREHKHDPNIIIIDETGDTRQHIQAALSDFNVEFYGRKEREFWLTDNNLPLDVVPNMTTDVIGFSLLVAKNRDYDMVVFVDDDTYPNRTTDFLNGHWNALTTRRMPTTHSGNDWVNPYPSFTLFGRGYPYAKRGTYRPFERNHTRSRPVLNMGLWDGVPDLNALDYLHLGALSGTYFAFNHPSHMKAGYVLGSRYMPLSRMNIAFNPEIIPAFYQGTGDKYEVGRYGDVFSGLFLAKIAAHLGDCVSFGHPWCYHQKEPRDVFRDIQSELAAVRLNETLYTVLDDINLDGKSYAECYVRLADGLTEHRARFHIPKYIDYLTARMRGWVDVVEA